MGTTLAETHLIPRDRMGRLMAFIARQIKDGVAASALGVAVNERTSLVVDRNGLAHVLGDGAVYFVLGDHPPEVCAPGTPLTFSNFKIWKVPSGGTFDLRNRPTGGWSYLVSVTSGQLSQNPY